MTVNTDKVTDLSHVTSLSSGSDPRTYENSDILASGDSGMNNINMNNIQSLSSSSYLSGTAVSASQNGLSETNETSSSYHIDGAAASAETDGTCVVDSVTGVDIGLCSPTMGNCRSTSNTETAISSVSSHVSSQALTESSETPIQQVVYT